MAEPGGSGATGTAVTSAAAGGRFDFDDGGTFLGGWDEGKAHGHGVCTGPKGQGAYSGAWHYGFEVSGVYIWPSGSAYEGQWQNGKRHGLGVESRGRWMYRGEWSQGFKGRYGVRQSSTSNARYEGTWANGLQDGYGSETYADGGTYQGQWLRGMRHGYGVRASAPFGQASHYRPNKNLRASLTSLRSVDGGPEAQAAERDRRVDDSRGGFVLKAKSDDPPLRRRSLVERSSNIKKSILSKIKKQRSTGDLDKRGTSGGSIRSTGSSASWVSTESSQSGVTGSLHTDSNASFVVEDEHMDASVTETYLGEWKNDKRSGFGISERSDGLKYEGEWFNNKKYGYGVTTFRDGSKEEGKYKNNLLITSQKKKHLFLIRSAKFRERIDAAVNAAQRASKIALQKADIAISRTATARGKAEMADLAAEHAREDFEIAQAVAKQFAPEFVQPGLEKLRNRPPASLKPPGPPDTSATMQSKTPGVNSEDPYQSSNSYQPSSTGYQPSNSTSYQPTNSSSYQPTNNTSYQSANSTSYQPPSATNQKLNSSFQNIPRQVNSSYQNIPGSMGAGGYGPGQSGASESPYQDYRQTNAVVHSTPEPQARPQQGIGALVTQTSPLPPQLMPDGSSSRDGRDSSYHHVVTPPTPIPHEKLDDRGASTLPNRTNTIRRNSRQVSGDSPSYNFQQAMSDHFDHYKRAPSRDPSLDRFSRGGSRLAGSRQPSVDKTVPGSPPPETPPPPSVAAIHAAMASSGGSRAPSIARSTAGNGSVVGAPPLPRATTPFAEEVATLKTRVPQTQEVIPSAVQPKRTESLLIPNNKPVGGPVGGGRGGGGGGGPPPKVKSIPVSVNLQRKKSLDPTSLPLPAEAMSREEASVLSSARREELRRMHEEAEKLKANPLLWLVSPHVKEWFSRQQLVMLVLFINISLAIMFYKLLT